MGNYQIRGVKARSINTSQCLFLDKIACIKNNENDYDRKSAKRQSSQFSTLHPYFLRGQNEI